MAKAQIRQYVFNAALGQIEIPGKVDLQQLLVITDTTKNVILYNFADPTFTGTTVSFLRQNDLNFISALDNTDGSTTIQLNAATIASITANSLASSDVLQILYEQPFQYVRSPEIGTDAFERTRVAAPQSLIDADFEYGMQPTKWLTISQQRAYPSIYEIPGTDIAVTTATSDASTSTGGAAVNESLITITTQIAHGYTVGQPFTIKGFNSAYQGFDRAEGSFVVYTVPTSTTFTFFAKGKVGYNINDNIYTPFIQLRQGGFYTGSNINAVIPVTAVASTNGTGSVTATTSVGSTAMTITAVSSVLPVGSVIAGTGIAAGTYILSQNTATNAATATLTSVGGDAIGQPVVTFSAVTSVAVGQFVVGAGIPANTYVLSINSTTFKVTLSSNLTSASTASSYNFYIAGQTGTYTLSQAAITGATSGLTITGTYNNLTVVNSNASTPGTQGLTVGAAITVSTVTTNAVATGQANLAGTTNANYIAVGTTIGMYPNMPLAFSGTSFGGLVTGTTYYVQSIVDSRTLTVVTTSGGSTNPTLTATIGGNMYIVGGATFGGLSNNTQYYISSVNSGSSISISNNIVYATTVIATNATNNYVTFGAPSIYGIGGTNNMTLGEQIIIGQTLGNLTAGATYYVIQIVDSRNAILSNSPYVAGSNNLAATMTTNSGSVTAYVGTNLTLSTTTGYLQAVSVNQPTFSYTTPTATATSTGSTLVGTTFTIGTVTSGTFAAGQGLSGTNVPSGTTIVSNISGSGNGSTWTVSTSGNTISVGQAINGVGTSATITINTTSPHGFVPGDTINVLQTSDTGFNNSILLSGPFFIETTPTNSTFTYTARGNGIITGTIAAQIYARPDSFYSHRPFDGGVQLGTGLPAHGSQAIRMSKKYIRYQSGKAINFNTGLLMAPNYFVRSVTSNIQTYQTAVSITAVTNTAGVITVVSGTYAQYSPITITTTVGAGTLPSGTYFIMSAGGSGVTSLTLASTYNNAVSAVPVTFTGTGSVTATAIVAPLITIVTDDVDHGCQIGAVVTLSGVLTSGYNGTYPVAGIIDERTVVCAGTQTLGTSPSSVTGATVVDPALLSINNWSGAVVRSGTFDEQNGVFWQYDGRIVSAVRRSSTFQLAGTVTVVVGSGQVVGINTRFTSQLWAGDRIVIRGMTHLITQVVSDTLMYVNPQYRGYASLSGIKITKTIDRAVPQSQWNLDTMDGSNGPKNPSGYLLVPTKMQMVCVQWTWYGAGFIDWMLRGPEGKYVTCHRLRNNNLNNEAWMRAGNLPVRYEVQNESSRTNTVGTSNVSTTTLALGTTDTVITVADSSSFPTPPAGYSQAVFIDNEIITYTQVVNTYAISTNASGNTVTLANLTNIVAGMPIVFNNAFAYNIGNIIPNQTYYVLNPAAGVNQITLATSYANYQSSTVMTQVTASAANITYYQTVCALTGCTRAATINPWAAGGPRIFSAGAATSHASSVGVILINGTASPIVSHWGAAFIEDGGFDTDRSYIFNYAQPNVNISTKKTTAFAVRLAPSVSNALPGDLGARELINRASFLLQTLESSAGSGAGNAALVIEGVINPSNMPAISNIQFASLNSVANPTGQPSFSQVAPGSSMVFANSINNFLNVSVYATAGTNYVPLTANPASNNPAILVGDDVFFPANTASLYGQTKVQTLLNYSAANGNAPSYTAAVGVTTLASLNITSTGGVVSFTSNGAVANGQVVVITGTASAGSIGGITAFGTTIATTNVFYLNSATATGATLYSIQGSNIQAAVSTTSGGAITGITNNVYAGAYSSQITISGTTLSVNGGLQGTIAVGMLLVGAGITTGTYIVAQLGGFAAGTLATYTVSISQTISTNTPCMFVAQTMTVSVANANPILPGALITGGTLPANTWVGLQLTNTSTSVGNTGTYALVNGSGTVIPVSGAAAGYGGTYYGIYLNQALFAGVAGSSTLSAQVNLSRSTYALPGETVFSYINAPANKDSLDLTSFKELTNTPIGGRGTYPNGCDILFVNAYITQGSPINQNLVLRWGEAQA